MADVFREVDEDLRREQIRKLWDRWAPYVLGLAVLIVLAVSGYKLWEYFTQRQAQTSGDQFISAMDLADQGKNADALTALQAVVQSGTGDYPILARFRSAAAKADGGDSNGAVSDFDAIANTSGISPDLRDLARLRAALLLVDTSSEDEINKRIGDLAAVGNPWKDNAREIQGLSAYQAGDWPMASNYFTELDADQDAAMDMRQRAELMLTLIAAKMPQPVAPAAAPTDTGAAPTPATSATGTAPAPVPAPPPAALAPAPLTTAAPVPAPAPSPDTGTSAATAPASAPPPVADGASSAAAPAAAAPTANALAAPSDATAAAPAATAPPAPAPDATAPAATAPASAPASPAPATADSPPG